MKNIFKQTIIAILILLFFGGITSAVTLLYPYGGGTGTGTLPKSGQVLIGNSGYNYTPAYLTAGTNITIATSSGAITISASVISGVATTTINNVSGPTFTFATSSDTNLGLTISTSTGQITFTPYWIGTLADGRIASAATWNAKQSALTFPLVYASTTHITATTPLVITSGVLSMPTSTSAISGYLSSADWTTFNNKLSSYTETDPIWNAASSTFLTTASSTATYFTIVGANASNTAWTSDIYWTGTATNLVAATGRTSLGLGTMALEPTTNYLATGTIGVSVQAYNANTALTNSTMTGLWNGTPIAYNYGGTGTSTALALQNLWWGNGSGGLVQVASSTLAGGGGVSSLNTYIGALTLWGTNGVLTVTASGTVGLVFNVPNNATTGSALSVFSGNLNIASTTLIMGTGFDLDTNTLNMDFNEFTTITSLLGGDMFPLWQDTAGDEKKITWDNLMKEITTIGIKLVSDVATTGSNVASATALANNPSDCGAGTKAISIDASGNLTCSAVDISADTNLAAGRSLTMSGDSVEADAEIYTLSSAFVIRNATTTQNPVAQKQYPNAITITRISCSTSQASSTIQFDERAEATPNTGGTDVLTTALICVNTTTTASTAFANAGIAANAIFNLDLDTMTGGSTTTVNISVYYTIDD